MTPGCFSLRVRLFSAAVLAFLVCSCISAYRSQSNLCTVYSYSSRGTLKLFNSHTLTQSNLSVHIHTVYSTTIITTTTTTTIIITATSTIRFMSLLIVMAICSNELFILRKCIMTRPQPHVWHQLQGLAVTCSHCAQLTECVHYEFPEPMLPETEPQIIIIFYHLDSAGRRLGACVQYFSKDAFEAYPWECYSSEQFRYRP